ncbi:TetR family transcriptional regulator [Nocardia sp. NPDC051570]|uniref:TetR/AcrR family transcriptional regulator n=1 Tax=Nocardia sp. NPDC051570 TaxID=3364324 RepID=UPI0037996671
MESEPAATFQRARRPEQRELRRQAILDAAQQLLSELPAADISLREIARRLGGSKSGIVRYYETREALFLEVLQRAMREWLDDLEHRLSAAADPLTARAVAGVWATSLAERPLLAELWSMLPGVLERNVSAESIREFKLANRRTLLRLAEMIAARLPGLSASAAEELVNASVPLLVGLWPFANPTPTVRAAIADPRLTASRIDFAQTFGRTLEMLIAGLLELTRD